MTIQLAMYRGPARGFLHKLSHWGICLYTLSRWSHCEIVIDGVCYSSSARDGGIRAKAINLHDGKWDVFYLDGVSKDDVLEWFNKNMGKPYDWFGVARFVLPFLRQRPDEWFCSEACAEAIGVRDGCGMSPDDLFSFAADKMLIDKYQST